MLYLNDQVWLNPGGGLRVATAKNKGGCLTSGDAFSAVIRLRDTTARQVDRRDKKST